MWKRELLKNKIYALIFIGIGALSVCVDERHDATFFVFSLMLGIPLFFAKENWIMGNGGSQDGNQKSRRKNIRRISYGC